MKKLAVALGSLAFLAVAGSANAGSITWNLTYEFSGAATPVNTLKVVLTDSLTDGSLASDEVSLKITFVDNGGTTEFISNIFLNYKGSPTIAFSDVDTSAVASSTESVGDKAFKADGDGWFDIEIVLPPPPAFFADKFTGGETLEYLFTGSADITVDDFADTSATKKGGSSDPDGLFVAAHAQGIADTGDGTSGWVTIPEPSGAILFGIGTLLAGAAIRRRS